jgi:hypothetical protein
MLDSGAVRVLHGGAVGIPEAKAAEVFGSLRGLRVEIGIGVDSLVTLVQMIHRGLAHLDE